MSSIRRGDDRQGRRFLELLLQTMKKGFCFEAVFSEGRCRVWKHVSESTDRSTRCWHLTSVWA